MAKTDMISTCSSPKRWGDYPSEDELEAGPELQKPQKPRTFSLGDLSAGGGAKAVESEVDKTCGSEDVPNNDGLCDRMLKNAANGKADPTPELEALTAMTAPPVARATMAGHSKLGATLLISTASHLTLATLEVRAKTLTPGSCHRESTSAFLVQQQAIVGSC